MTREEYLVLRNNHPALLYKVYAERHNPSKHGRLLNPQELLTFLPMWGNPHDIIMEITQEHDAKFGLIHVTDRNGQYIMTI